MALLHEERAASTTSWPLGSREALQGIDHPKGAVGEAGL